MNAERKLLLGLIGGGILSTLAGLVMARAHR